jgi:hypothetical protein
MDETEIATLKQRITQLETDIGILHYALERAVQLVDRYSDTLGRHLKLTLADQGELSLRVAAVERRLSG